MAIRLENRILITGFSGFVGAGLIDALQSKSLVLLGRKEPKSSAFPFYKFSFNEDSSCERALQGVDVVIHCAARVHIMQDSTEQPLAAFREVNTLATLALAKQAAAAGVKRFIFISSIKVNGEQTAPGVAFSSVDTPSPQDPYGISKAEAEQGLKELAKQTGMQVVIIRPPLVYGAGVKGNFAALQRLAAKNLPLPLGAITNKRSMVALDNLVDLIITCIDHPAAANQTFLVSDDHDLSTTELLTLLTKAAGKKPRLLPVPVSWLNAIGKITGKQAIIDRLCGNLQVDIRHTKDTLGWQPPISVEEGIRRCYGVRSNVMTRLPS